FAMLDAFRANENGAAPLPLTANSDLFSVRYPQRDAPAPAQSNA
ncbi:hypothetical protein, partial [Escherichia coli]